MLMQQPMGLPPHQNQHRPTYFEPRHQNQAHRPNMTYPANNIRMPIHDIRMADPRIAIADYPPVSSVHGHRLPFDTHSPSRPRYNPYGDPEKLRADYHRNNEERDYDRRGDEQYRNGSDVDGRYEEDRRREHSREDRHRRRKSRSRSRSRSKSRSPKQRRRSRSKSRSQSPDRKNRKSPKREKDGSKRKFTEEPKKRRKFSEDPKLLEKANSLRPVVNDGKAPKLQFRSKKDSNSKKTVSLFVPPPPLPPMFGQPKNIIGSRTNIEDENVLNDEGKDVFKAPPPINILKPAPKALKIGALSSLTAYDDDSDEDS